MAPRRDQENWQEDRLTIFLTAAATKGAQRNKGPNHGIQVVDPLLSPTPPYWLWPVLKSYESPASGEPSHWEIRDKLRRGGYHQIEVSVQNLDSGQPWDITFDLLAVDNQNHREENLGTSQLNPNTVTHNPNGTIRIDQSTGLVHDTLPVWVKYHDEAAEQRAVSNASSNQ
jgi:hypothetical protein